MQSKQWREAMVAAKVAVRAYVRNPSADNASQVELAWKQVRRVQSVAEWRRPTIGSTPSPSMSATGRPETFTDAR